MVRGVRSEVWLMWCYREVKQLSRFAAGSGPVSDLIDVGTTFCIAKSVRHSATCYMPDHAVRAVPRWPTHVSAAIGREGDEIQVQGPMFPSVPICSHRFTCPDLSSFPSGPERVM